MCGDKIHQGGGVAAPVGGQIFSEILPYLEVNQGNTEEIEQKVEVEVPEVVGMSIKEAEKVLKEKELEVKINNETENLDKENTIITNQIPRSGLTVYSKSCVYLEY